jgi:Na+-driven multidrug efflux pump
VGIANQYDGIIYQLVCAPSVAAIPYVAQNIGAGDSRRAKRAILCAMLITIGFGASLGSFSAIFAPQLSGLLATTTAARDYAVQKMIIISSTYFICGINEVVGGALKGMGRPISPMIANLIYLCGLRCIWVYAIFPLVPNLTFLYLVWPISWTCSIVTLLPFLSHALRSLGRKRAAAAEGAAST